MKKKTKIILAISIPVGVIALTISAFFIYVSVGQYKAGDKAITALNSKEVEITQNNDYIFFNGSGSKDALILYPGAKVESKAYSPLALSIAKSGTDVFILECPFNIALFSQDKYKDVIKDYHYDNYYLGGHSLGGCVSSLVIEDNNKIKGLFFIAAYPDKNISNYNLKTLLMYGSNDGVIDLYTYNSNKKYLPNDYQEVIIGGGNHSQFGDYGLQSNDHEASISMEEQIKVTTETWMKFLADGD